MRQHPRIKIAPSVFILLGVMMLFASRYWQVQRVPQADYQMLEPKQVSKPAEPKKGIVQAMTTQAPAALPQPAPNSKPSEHPFASSTNPEIRELSRLVKCAQSQACDYDKSTPISYSYLVGQAIATQLKKLDSQKPSEEDTRVARTFMMYPDDYVKSAALSLLATSEPSPENMNALLTGLRDSVSAPLYQEALETLEKYKGTPELDKFLVETVQTGGHFASIEMAKHSLRFLSQQNAPQLERAALELPPQSPSREYLEANLREFKRLQEGG